MAVLALALAGLLVASICRSAKSSRMVARRPAWSIALEASAAMALISALLAAIPAAVVVAVAVVVDRFAASMANTPALLLQTFSLQAGERAGMVVLARELARLATALLVAKAERFSPGTFRQALGTTRPMRSAALHRARRAALVGAARWRCRNWKCSAIR